MLAFAIIAAFIVLILFLVDRHLCLKDVEKDLKLTLGDFLIARDLSSDQVRVHYQATVSSLKSLIRRHFKD
jgi:hypothetical protein